ncbi:MAG: fibronectin type III domain-containing protein [Clostridia bacterium]|nr:fibronectin type III domain-containing protein [Clostridia bacterium]
MNRKQKFISVTLAILIALTSTLILSITSVSALATGISGNPNLSHDNVDNDGNYKITMNMWWGNNGTSWKVYENGQVVYTASLTDNSPNQQSAVYSVTGKTNGSYVYSCDLINAYGKTTSQTITVVVTNGPTPPPTPTFSSTPTPTPTVTSLPSSSPVKRINIPGERRSLKAIITCSSYKTYTANNDFVNNCFDNNIYTDMSTIETNPGYIKIDFINLKKVSKMRAYLGRNQAQKFQVETANTAGDMETKSGSYAVLVPYGNEVSTPDWVEYAFPQGIEKKIWRFEVKAQPDSNTTVTMPEIEMWAYDLEMPTQPANLAATPVDARTVKLTWSPSSDADGITGYNIYRGGTYVGSCVGTTYNDLYLEPNQSYSYTVKAFDAFGNESPSSQSVSATTTGTLPLKTEYNILAVRYDTVFKAGESYTYYDPVSNITRTKTFTADTSIADYIGGTYNTSNWRKSAQERATQFANDFNKASGNTVNFKVYKTLEINDTPPANDDNNCGKKFWVEFIELKALLHDNQKSYYVFHHGGFNYHRLFLEQNIIKEVEEGNVDILLLYNAEGCWEASIIGNTGFSANGATQDMLSSRNALLLMGDSTESFGHAIDFGLMPYQSQKWPESNKLFNAVRGDTDLNDRVPQNVFVNDWSKFTTTDAYNYLGVRNYYSAPGQAQVGSIHCPPYAIRQYGWIFNDWNTDYCNDFTPDKRKTRGSWEKNEFTDVLSVEQGADARTICTSNFDHRDFVFADFEVSTQIRVSNSAPDAEAGLIFRVEKYTMNPDEFSGYYAALNVGQNKLILYKYDFATKTRTEIASKLFTPALQTDKFYPIKIKTSGSNIKIFMMNNSTPFMDVTDYSYAMGTFGYKANNTQAHYYTLIGDVTVNSYADTWYTYPNLSGAPKPLSNSTFNRNGENYQQWWFSHIPRNPGVHDVIRCISPQNGSIYYKTWDYQGAANSYKVTDPTRETVVYRGMLNNWWFYFLDLNHFNQEAGDPAKALEITGFKLPVPTDLKATNITSTSLTLNWNPTVCNKSPLYYRVYKNDGKNTNVITVDTPQLVEAYLLPGKTYTYNIEAFTPDGTMSAKTEISVTTPIN